VADADISLGHLVPLTLQYLISSSGGGGGRYIKDTFHVSPLPITSTETYGRMLAAVVIFTPVVLTNIWTKLNTDMECAGILSVPVLNVCNFCKVRLQVRDHITL